MAYIGPEPNPGQNREVDDISSGFNGGTAAFTLQVNGQNVSPGSANNIIVSLGGVIQNPGTDYNIAGSTITFTTNPASGLSFFGLVLGQQIDAQSLADGTSPTMSAPTITGDLSIADKIVHTGDTNTAIRFSAADTVSVETAGSERLTVQSDGDIGLATTSPNASSFSGPTVSIGKSANPYSVLELQGNNTSDGAFGIILGYNSGGSARTTQINFNRQAANNSGSISFETASAGSLGERVRITNDGLTFNGDTATANALSDYEEGSWTPGISFGGGTTGQSLSAAVGRYTKIGNIVYLKSHITIGTRGSSTGHARITGLPFVATGDVSAFTPIADRGTVNLGTGAVGMALFLSGSSSPFLYGYKFNGAGNFAVQHDPFTTNSEIDINIVYRTS